MPRRQFPLVCAGVALSLLAGACSSDTDPPALSGDDRAGTSTPTAPSPATRAGFEQIPSIVREVEPSVVAVLTGTGEGSGVIWRSDGLILTNHHVVQNADALRVAFADGERVRAQVVASDPLTDLALLRTERDGLPAATFAAHLPTVGELAVAIGNPLGFENTVTAGIISGLHRAIPGSAPSTQSLIDLIQTDAAISPGNSGGALVDGDGDVVGINVAYIPPQARAVSIGFAIPAVTVADVARQLLRTGSVRHSFFGIQPGPLTEWTARLLDVRTDSGVVVLAVTAGGPADSGGIEPGDIIVGIDGEEIESVEEFLAVLRRHKPADELRVEIVRDGARATWPVVLGERPRA